MVADSFCHKTFPGILEPFLLASLTGQQQQMSAFLTQYFSRGSLRELQERRHFCHKTFQDSGKNGLLLQPRLRKMVTLLPGKELCQSALVLPLQYLDTWKRNSSNAKRIDSNDTGPGCILFPR
jgi:hypothetical protein